MIENPAANSADNAAQPISARDLAAYIFELSGELANMAGHMGLSKVAAALELARTLAGEAAAVNHNQPGQNQPGQNQPGPGKAAPEDAA